MRGERDVSQWTWSRDQNDYYTSHWNRDLNQWETVWKQDVDSNTAPPGIDLRNLPAESEVDSRIIKAGVIYQELDEFQKRALVEHLEEIRAHGTSWTASTSEYPHCIRDEKVYHPLNDSQEMRVLELFAGKKEDAICCKLHVCSVGFKYPSTPKPISADIPRDSLEGITFTPHTRHAVSYTAGQPVWYTALSYVWGDPAFVRPMICNGKPFKTTKNLDLALRYLRRTDTAVLLWIDQICINQDDPKEKTQQVILMSKIYQRAWSTVVWLGEEANNSNGALETISTIAGALQYYTDERAPDLEDFERMALPAPESAKWFELSDFLSRPWFQRVWVIQEIVLSHNIHFMCGEKCIPWSDVELFIICMEKHDLIRYLNSSMATQRQISQSACRHIYEIYKLKSYNDSFPSQSTLLSLLVEGRRAQATDLRDKVFAVMGMSSTIINPDYSKGVFDVYAEAAQPTLSSNNLISMLCCVDHAHPAADHPSWIPDWGIPRQTTSLGYLGRMHGVYKAAEDTKLQSKTKPGGSSLAVVGMLFDTISKISALADPFLQDLSNNKSPTSEFVTRSMHLAMKHCQPYPSKSGLFDAFWRTLVAGKDETGSTKAPSDFAAIFALLIDSATGSSPSMPDQPNPKRKLTLENLKFRRPSHIYRQMQVAFEAAVKGRRFGTTSKRYMGLLPRGTKLGDEICIFSGGYIPFVIRRQATSSSYQLVGECYVNGIMNGEAMEMADLKMQDIELV